MLGIKKFFIALDRGEQRHDLENYFKSCGFEYKSLDIEQGLAEISSIKDLVLFMDEDKTRRLANNSEFKQIIKKNHVPIICYSFKSNNLKNDFEGNASINLPLNIDHFEDVTKLNIEKINLSYQHRELKEKEEDDFKIKQLGELSASLLHDLANYLTISKSSFDTIEHLIQKTNDENIKDKILHLSGIGKSGLSQLDEFIKKYESFLQSDTSLINYEEVNLKDFIPYVFSFLSVDLAKNKVKIENSINSDFFINSDKSILLTSILNLLKNSIEAIKNNKDRIIKTTLLYKGADAFISIVDSGSISDDVKEKVFQKGYSSKKSSSSGLGLYLIKRQLEQMGYGIQLRESKSTNFVIKIPSDFVIKKQ